MSTRNLKTNRRLNHNLNRGFNRSLVAFFMLFVLFSLGSYVLLRHTAIGCEALNGRWATNGQFCIAYDCYHNNSCGLLAYPARECAELKLGDSIAKVYFYLGEPSLIEGGVYTWQDKTGGEFSATLSTSVSQVSSDSRLLTLECLASAVD